MSKHLGVEYKTRMPQELKDKIVESAEVHNRSLNADIVARLEQTFKPNEELIKALSFGKVMSLFADHLSEDGLAFVIIKKEDVPNFESGRHLLNETKTKAKTPEEFDKDYPDIQKW